MSLKILDMLQYKVFRDKLKDPAYTRLLKDQLFLHAQYSMQMLFQRPQPTPANVPLSIPGSTPAKK